MKEQDLLKIIKSQIGGEYIGDDCAYLKDFNIVITQDSLVEGVHFKRDWYSPNELGYKSVAVNISDVLASGAKPVYVTIALSLPKDINENFVKEFYIGAKEALCGAKIVGGDITGSDKLYISITALGDTKRRFISSRSGAKSGYVVITSGLYGGSSAGLRALINSEQNDELINSHKKPILNEEFSRLISVNINEAYAMMDTSDGLADALFKIAQASNVSIDIDYEKIPKSVQDSNDVLFGGEDYNLIAAVPNHILSKLNKYTIIGHVKDYSGYFFNVNGKEYKSYDDIKVYNHFE